MLILPEAPLVLAGMLLAAYYGLQHLGWLPWGWLECLGLELFLLGLRILGGLHGWEWIKAWRTFSPWMLMDTGCR